MRPFVAALLPCLLVAPALGEIVQIGASRDNTLYEDPTGMVTNGGGTAMFAGRNSLAFNPVRRAILAFDVAAAVPAGATITAVTLTLNNSSSNTGAFSFALHRLTGDWGEGSVIATSGQGSGAPAAPGDATWLHRSFNTVPWTTPGGDFVAAASSQTTVSAPGFYTWLSTPALVADVQGFLNQPGTNFGWIIIGGEGTTSSAKRFATREEPVASLRPVLSVTYIPTPGAAAVLALAGVLVTRRRRP